MKSKSVRSTTELNLHYQIAPYSMGYLAVARSDAGICALFLGDEPDNLMQELGRRFPNARFEPADQSLETLTARLLDYIESPGSTRVADLEAAGFSLDLRGTDFQKKVWRALCEVPAGQTATYTEIARNIGAPSAARAVAGACAANKIAVLVPCHRIVRSDGSLSGYRWGVARKRALLGREAVPMNGQLFER